MPICKGFQGRSKFACLYNSVKRLFPFICGRYAYAGLFLASACDCGRNPFLSRLLCIMRECGYNDETSHSNNCWFNLGLNDFSHERECRCQCTFGAFGRLSEQRLYMTLDTERITRNSLCHNLHNKWKLWEILQIYWNSISHKKTVYIIMYYLQMAIYIYRFLNLQTNWYNLT